jgi:hypothetical protein
MTRKEFVKAIESIQPDDAAIEYIEEPMRFVAKKDGDYFGEGEWYNLRCYYMGEFAWDYITYSASEVITQFECSMGWVESITLLRMAMQQIRKDAQTIWDEFGIGSSRSTDQIEADGDMPEVYYQIKKLLKDQDHD